MVSQSLAQQEKPLVEKFATDPNQSYLYEKMSFQSHQNTAVVWVPRNVIRKENVKKSVELTSFDSIAIYNIETQEQVTTIIPPVDKLSIPLEKVTDFCEIKLYVKDVKIAKNKLAVYVNIHYHDEEYDMDEDGIDNDDEFEQDHLACAKIKIIQQTFLWNLDTKNPTSVKLSMKFGSWLMINEMLQNKEIRFSELLINDMYLCKSFKGNIHHCDFWKLEVLNMSDLSHRAYYDLSRFENVNEFSIKIDLGSSNKLAIYRAEEKEFNELKFKVLNLQNGEIIYDVRDTWDDFSMNYSEINYRKIVGPPQEGYFLLRPHSTSTFRFVNFGMGKYLFVKYFFQPNKGHTFQILILRKDQVGNYCLKGKRLIVHNAEPDFGRN